MNKHRHALVKSLEGYLTAGMETFEPQSVLYRRAQAQALRRVAYKNAQRKAELARNKPAEKPEAA